MRVLVTGGAGFIGSHLVEAHLKRGDSVYVIDNLSTGSKENISLALIHKRFSFVQETILNPEVLFGLIANCDVVYHLAAAVGVFYILEHPFDSIRTNIYGTELVLKFCSELNKKLLITSSSEVYGKSSHVPLLETDDSIIGSSGKFRWSYATSKLIDEFMALAYYKADSLRVIVTRLFNTVGPRQTGAYGMVIPRFVEQALNGDNITVYGDGKQTRTFTYIDDVVFALMSLMESDKSIGEVFNVGGNKEMSIVDLAKKIVKLSGSKSVIRCIPYKKVFDEDFEDIRRRVPGIQKIKDCIGFEPQTSLDEMILRIIAFKKENK